MKYFIVLLLILIAVSSKAQITLEHTYGTYHIYHDLVEVDSGLFKYVFYNKNDSVTIYNLDHTLDRLIILPIKDSAKANYYEMDQISKRLFDADDSYEILISKTANPYNIRIYKENGDVLFGCENCNLSDQYGINFGISYPNSIVNTDKGVKMMIDYWDKGAPFQTAVFSLPGKLPGCTAKSGVNAPTIINGNSLPTSAYPNPSNGQMRISYSLPSGETTGELVILSTDGVEVKRYRVGEGFNDILVEKGDLSSGSYFYKLVTEKGESEVNKLVIIK
jgi:hypothetical protein